MKVLMKMSNTIRCGELVIRDIEPWEEESWLGRTTILGVDFHVSFIRVHLDADGCQQPTHDGNEALYRCLAELAGADSPFQTCKVPALDPKAEFVVWMEPFCE